MKYIFLIFSLFLCTPHLSHTMGQRKKKSLNFIHQEQLCLDAIYNNKPEQLKTALARGADVNFTNIDRESLFCLARKKNNQEILKILITHKDIDIYARDSNDYTPLHVACTLGLPITVASILNKAPQIAYMCSNREALPLHLAAYHWQKDCIELLLSHDVSTINCQGMYNDTALHNACRQVLWVSPKQYFDTIKLLIEKGADPTIKNNNQLTPLICLFSFYDNKNALYFFLVENPNMTHKFIHTKDKYDNSQFHLCTTITSIDPAKFEKYLQFLTSHGLNIHSRNKDGKRAVDLACDAYNHYSAMTPPDMKKIKVQQQIMHAFLRFTSPHTSCALFKQMLEQSFQYVLEQQNINNQELPKQFITQIMCDYYVLNIETIIAKNYNGLTEYYDVCIEKKDTLRQKLLVNYPKPRFLWSAQ
jgi:ankyrin repeat protein